LFGSTEHSAQQKFFYAELLLFFFSQQSSGGGGGRTQKLKFKSVFRIRISLILII